MFVVFDLDGTLADDSHRQHHIESDPKDWTSYFAECGGDAVIAPIAHVLHALVWADHEVEVWTGRSETAYMATRDWVDKHFSPSIWKAVSIRMRPETDYRPDTELKGQWLAECGGSPPDLVFDDRTKSVAWWREQGIVCCQVAQHDY